MELELNEDYEIDSDEERSKRRRRDLGIDDGKGGEEKLEEAKNLLSLITNAKYTEEEKIKIVRELLYSGRGIGFSYPKPFRIELQEQLMSLVCQLPFGHRSSRLFTLRNQLLNCLGAITTNKSSASTIVENINITDVTKLNSEQHLYLFLLRNIALEMYVLRDKIAKKLDMLVGLYTIKIKELLEIQKKTPNYDPIVLQSPENLRVAEGLKLVLNLLFEMEGEEQVIQSTDLLQNLVELKLPYDPKLDLIKGSDHFFGDNETFDYEAEKQKGIKEELVILKVWWSIRNKVAKLVESLSDDDGKMAEIKFKIFINLLEYARDYQITLKHVTVLFSNLTEWLPILNVLDNKKFVPKIVFEILLPVIYKYRKLITFGTNSYDTPNLGNIIQIFFDYENFPTQLKNYIKEHIDSENPEKKFSSLYLLENFLDLPQDIDLKIQFFSNVIKLLSDKDEWVRTRAVRLYGSYSNVGNEILSQQINDTINNFLQHLEDPSDYVRCQASASLCLVISRITDKSMLLHLLDKYLDVFMEFIDKSEDTVTSTVTGLLFEIKGDVSPLAIKLCDATCNLLLRKLSLPTSTFAEQECSAGLLSILSHLSEFIPKQNPIFEEISMKIQNVLMEIANIPNFYDKLITHDSIGGLLFISFKSEKIRDDIWIFLNKFSKSQSSQELAPVLCNLITHNFQPFLDYNGIISVKNLLREGFCCIEVVDLIELLMYQYMSWSQAKKFVTTPKQNEVLEKLDELFRNFIWNFLEGVINFSNSVRDATFLIFLSLFYYPENITKMDKYFKKVLKYALKIDRFDINKMTIREKEIVALGLTALFSIEFSKLPTYVNMAYVLDFTLRLIQDLREAYGEDSVLKDFGTTPKTSKNEQPKRQRIREVTEQEDDEDEEEYEDNYDEDGDLENDMINSYNHLLLYDQKESLLLKVINLPLMFYDYYQRHKENEIYCNGLLDTKKSKILNEILECGKSSKVPVPLADQCILLISSHLKLYINSLGGVPYDLLEKIKDFATKHKFDIPPELSILWS